jgi:methylmalonyl-CoA mutase C-terminal domain/subunit
MADMDRNKFPAFRILVAKCGLDGHDRGARTIALALRDVGMEVIYTGLHQTPEKVVNAALQEDVDAIGISILSGAHMHILPRVQKLMQDNGLQDVLLFGGGVIPPDDAESLQALGMGRLFPPGTSVLSIVEYLNAELNKRKPKRGESHG